MIALSLANLCCLSGWIYVTHAANFYYHSHAPGLAHFGAFFLVLALLSTCFWLLARVGRAAKGRLRTACMIGFLLVLIVPLNSMRFQIPWLSAPAISRHFGLPVLAALGIGLATLLAVALRRATACARIAASVLMILSPFVLFTTGKVFYQWIGLHRGFGAAQFADGPLAGPVPNTTASTRLVLIVFDMMDETLATRYRPVGFELKQFDSLRRESVVATAAMPPGNSTLPGVPTILSGVAVQAGTPVSSRDMMLNIAGVQRPVLWSSLPNLFSVARNAGVNTAAVGFFHPYCRMFRSELNSCWWRSYFASQNLSRTLELQLNLLLSSVPLGYRIAKLAGRELFPIELFDAQRHARIYQSMLREAVRVAADSTLGFVYVHLPVPHTPIIYDRSTGRVGPNESGDYFDNLTLADNTLGAIRQALVEGGVSDRTALIITADHGMRDDVVLRVDGREAVIRGDALRPVPLMVHWPSGQRGLTVVRPLPLTSVYDVAVGILNGTARSQEGVAAILQRNARAFPTPVRDQLVLHERSP